MRLTFDTAERNEKFGRIQRQRSREQQLRKEKEASIPLQKDSESRSKSKVIPTRFMKSVGKRLFVGAKDRIERNG